MPGSRGSLPAVTVLAALCVAAGLAPARLEAATPAAALEYEVKAAFLFNFAQYVTWPDRAFASRTAPLVIAVLGEDPFGDLLDKTVEGHTVQGRTVVIRRIRSGDTPHGSHVLFVSASETPRLSEVLAATAGDPILTVADLARFCDAGGMIQLVVADRRVAFDVNVDATAAAGLVPSGRLLGVARRVIGRRR